MVVTLINNLSCLSSCECLWVNCSITGLAQHSTLTIPPKHLQELPLTYKDLDAMAMHVSHINVSSAVTEYPPYY